MAACCHARHANVQLVSSETPGLDAINSSTRSEDEGSSSHQWPNGTSLFGWWQESNGHPSDVTCLILVAANVQPWLSSVAARMKAEDIGSDTAKKTCRAGSCEMRRTFPAAVAIRLVCAWVPVTRREPCWRREIDVWRETFPIQQQEWRVGLGESGWTWSFETSADHFSWWRQSDVCGLLLSCWERVPRASFERRVVARMKCLRLGNLATGHYIHNLQAA